MVELIYLIVAKKMIIYCSGNDISTVVHQGKKMVIEALEVKRGLVEP